MAIDFMYGILVSTCLVSHSIGGAAGKVQKNPKESLPSIPILETVIDCVWRSMFVAYHDHTYIEHAGPTVDEDPPHVERLSIHDAVVGMVRRPCCLQNDRPSKNAKLVG